MNVQPKTGRNLFLISTPSEPSPVKTALKFWIPFQWNRLVPISFMSWLLYVVKAREIMKMVGRMVNTRAAMQVGVSMVMWKRLSSSSLRSSAKLVGFLPIFSSMSALNDEAMFISQIMKYMMMTAMVTKPNRMISLQSEPMVNAPVTGSKSPPSERCVSDRLYRAFQPYGVSLIDGQNTMNRIIAICNNRNIAPLTYCL